MRYSKDLNVTTRPDILMNELELRDDEIEELLKALREIHLLRPAGPCHNKLVVSMEEISGYALRKRGVVGV